MSNLQGTLSAGQAVGGNYEILGVAGSGGMGVVYRALDRRLNRTVALKFLPGELSATPRDRERFLREARTASSLDHPNIGVIHAIEETADGQGFIVMAYYDGESLAVRIRKGTLSELEAVDIAIQMARGLAEAHSRHIIHRDIKPSNVMLTSTASQVRIVDFGLAQVTNQQTATSSGATGTINYMSPEQALERGADHRTDIWSLGVTLAEMLTGRNPFEREGVSATLLSILNEPPRPMPTITPALQEIVYRALAKDVTVRYQTMDELLADLEREWPLLSEAALPADPGSVTMPASGANKGSRSAGSAQFRRAIARASQSAIPQLQDAQTKSSRLLIAASVLGAFVVVTGILLLVTPIRERLAGIFLSSSQKHIAVLPFDNVSGDPSDAILVAGLIDSLSDRLSNLDAGNQSLWVVPGSEVRRLKIDDPGAAFAKFGATLAVKGSVDRHGQNIQLTLELIDAKNLRQVGSAELEDTNGDIAALENKAVTSLARLMNLKVPTAEKQQAVTTKPGAYESYLTALGYLQRYDKAGNVDLAIDALRKSVALDPTFAVSYAQLGDALRIKGSLTHDSKWYAEAQENCRKALELNPDLPAAHVTLGRLFAPTQPDLSLQEFKRALQLDPRSADAESGLGFVYEKMGRPAEAEKSFQKAVALRPEQWNTYDELATFYDQAGRYKEAIQASKQALKLTPDNVQELVNLAAIYSDAGDATLLPEAVTLLLQANAISPTYAAYTNLGNVYSMLGRHAEGAAASEKALAMNDQDYVLWTNLVSQYEWLRQPEKAKAARLKAVTVLEHAIKVEPHDAAAHALLADMYAGLGDKEQALAHIQTTLALTPDDPQNLTSIADAYENSGDETNALRYSRLAVKKGLSLQQLKTDPELQPLLSRIAESH